MKIILYSVLGVLSVACFVGGQWAGALTSFILLLILISLDRGLQLLTRIADQLDYQQRGQQGTGGEGLSTPVRRPTPAPARSVVTPSLDPQQRMDVE